MRSAARLAGVDGAGLAEGFRARFDDLADRGSLLAAVWLVRELRCEPLAPSAEGGATGGEAPAAGAVTTPGPGIGVALAAERSAEDAERPALETARRRALYERLAARAGEAPWVLNDALDVLRALRADAEELGADVAVELARRFRAAATDGRARADTLIVEAEAELARAGDGDADERTRVRALALLRRAVRAAPGTSTAAAAADAAWRLAHLVPGTPVPELVARDVDGNELCLSDLAGGAVVVHVWSLDDFGSAPALAPRSSPLDEWARWLEREHPVDVTLVGVCLGDDERAFRRARAEHGVDWPTALVDPAGDVPWRLRDAPAVFLVDGARVLRFVARPRDLAASAVPPGLDAAVARLAQEPASPDDPPAPRDARIPRDPPGPPGPRTARDPEVPRGP